MVHMEVRHPPSHRDRESEAVSSLMITFQGRSPRSLRKTFLRFKTGKRLREGIEKEFTIEMKSNL